MNSGAAFGLICPYFELGKLVAQKAQKILVEDAAPSSIPMDTIKRFHHQANPVAMKRLGIKLPESMLKSIELISAP